MVTFFSRVHHDFSPAQEKMMAIACRKTMTLFLCLLLTGCAGIGGTMPSAGKRDGLYPLNLKTAEESWWYARYQLLWPPDEAPAWHMDALIANEIVKPVLEKQREDIPLWRFHRRANRDAAGHQFSFIFYASPGTAQKVYDALRSSEIAAKFQYTGDILHTGFDDTKAPSKPALQDTSDPSWSKDLQKSWPWFIMGSSETWLALIGQAALEVGASSLSDTEEMKQCYIKVNERVTEQWREEAAHAFVHHLNALFGYEPFKVPQDRLIRF